MTPKRWATETRAWAYRFLALRDGEQCSLCKRKPQPHNHAKPQTLDIDHLDGNPSNNHPDNLRLLCRQCNVSLANARRTNQQTPSVLSVCERERKEGKSSTRIAREDANYRQGSPEMQANYLYEVPFRAWLMSKVNALGAYDKQTAIAEGAELFGCSTQTTTRYITKLTSPAGPLTETPDALGHKVLVLKSHLSNHPNSQKRPSRRAIPQLAAPSQPHQPHPAQQPRQAPDPEASR